jgi:vancomycin resistance protein VanJ
MFLRLSARRYLDFILWPSLWLLAGMVFSWLLLFLLTNDQIRAVRIIGYFQPCLLLLLVPGALAAAFGKRKFLAVILSCLVVVVGLPYLPLFLPRFGEQPKTGRELLVMSYSVNGWNKDIGAVAEVIRKTKADIIIEQGAPRTDELFDKLQGLYPDGEVHTLNYKDSGLVSRFPITPLRGISAAQKARIEIPDGPAITVWIVHTSKDPHGYREQVRQIKGIVADVLATEGPKIVGGDFNATEGTVPYRLLEEHLRNAHQQAGWGFGFTYPTPFRRLGSIMSFVRIDHIWYSDDFYALEAETLGDYGGSDHRPITATLAILAPVTDSQK